MTTKSDKTGEESQSSLLVEVMDGGYNDSERWEMYDW